MDVFITSILYIFWTKSKIVESRDKVKAYAKITESCHCRKAQRSKSALFNRICKKNLAIVDEAEGITRDRLYADADFFGTPFQIIDTGGIDARSKHNLMNISSSKRKSPSKRRIP